MHALSLKEAENCKRLWDVKNGIPFCKKCHRNIHKKYVEVGKILKELESEGKIKKLGIKVNGKSFNTYKAL